VNEGPACGAFVFLRPRKTRQRWTAILFEMNEPTTPPLIYESVREFLARHAPFSRMREEAFRFLIPRLKLAYFPKDAIIVDRQGGPFPPFHIIQSGLVSSVTAGLDTLPDRVLSPGECFPVGALSAGGQPTRTYRAVDDVFAYQLDVDSFNRLRQVSPEFEAFCTAAVTVLAQQSLAELQRHYAQVAADQHSLTRPLSEIVAREPVTCRADTTLREALTRMRDSSVRSIIVVDAEDAPIGVFTLNDLRDRVVLQQLPLDTPIERVMTRRPSTLAADATAAEAMQMMAAGGFHQMIVTDHGRVFGTVAEHDLFALQRVSLRQIHHAIRSSRTIAALAHVAVDIRNLAHNLLAQGASAETLTRTISALNDALTREVITRVLQDHDLTNIDWCWMALGSEGRGEQTLATDQDNALIFAAGPDVTPSEQLRIRHELLGFAREINEALATLGFPLCKGGIMASNPQWCLSEDEWRARFAQWLTEPTPEALLRANIFFDFRALFGDRALIDRLSHWLLARTQDNKLFLRLMVANALQTEPPLGLIRAFVVDDDADAPGTLDMKARGTRIFVDAARVFALAQGIAATGTAERLRRAGEQLRVEPRHVDATVDAFHYLQVLRLRAQHRRDAGGAPNRIDPYALNDIDQRMLKEVFRQARKLQQRLKETYTFGL
jgi:CBS domain-containing protein